MSLLRHCLYTYISFLKLVIKPDSLLLEDRRSQTSSEGHNQTSALPLFFGLALVDQHGEEIKDHRCSKTNIRKESFPEVKNAAYSFFSMSHVSLAVR